jgi:hypothetical protein
MVAATIKKIQAPNQLARSLAGVRVTTAEFVVDLNASDESDDCSDGIDELGCRLEVRSNHLGGFINSGSTVALRKN